MFEGFRLTPDLPPVWMAGFAVLAWGLGATVPLLRFDAGALASAPVWLGLGLILWAAWYFYTHRTPIEPGHVPKSFITRGPYRLNRNPIYTGLSLILLGIALGQGALSALLPALAYPFLITRRFVLPEEAALRHAFGAEAEAYFARTRRW
ncbi:isoprenylcysteine carboxylmethyltransferase family protein [Halovulum dunhuangense]|uniref:Isoprenylcysteine carboxylmethyltransferase family protein n=1 Tax=Halovulum dunhuangense TaxID=1505036 RepID=A0A849L475_9RHOB|nr:methyltransferase [Halovulum dunhuangense]NNU81004.1 isoprenylcysteine carboxylmethyltransferase family protein [Halovulum dunhuangense]